MHYEVEVGGKIRRVTVTRIGDGFAVTVDGRTHQVDVARIGPYMLSLIGDKVWRQETDRRREVREVVLVPGPTAQVTVSVGVTPVAVSLNGSRRGRRGG